MMSAPAPGVLGLPITATVDDTNPGSMVSPALLPMKMLTLRCSSRRVGSWLAHGAGREDRDRPREVFEKGATRSGDVELRRHACLHPQLRMALQALGVELDGGNEPGVAPRPGHAVGRNED